MTGKERANGGNIMVVDDQPANLKLLENMLRQQGYTVRSFPRGRLALAAAAHSQPDLILLDINMPEMNGYEVCTRLKATPELASIPVIFLSALDDTKDKVKAFQSGGVDYVSKPFQFEEVKVRVETHLELSRLQQVLQRHNDHLEDLVSSRTRELAEAHRRLKNLDQAKDDFLHLISHELRTPLNGIVGIGEMVLEELPAGVQADELRALFDTSRERVLAMLEDALLLTQVDVEGEKFARAPVSLRLALNRAVDRTAQLAASRNVFLQPVEEDLGCVFGHEGLLTRALEALLETAVHLSKTSEPVRLVPQSLEGGAVRLSIICPGSTLPPESIPRFFDVLTVSEASTGNGGVGLRPSVAHRILSLFGGSVSAENQHSGVCLIIDFQQGDHEPAGG